MKNTHLYSSLIRTWGVFGLKQMKKMTVWWDNLISFTHKKQIFFWSACQVVFTCMKCSISSFFHRCYYYYYHYYLCLCQWDELLPPSIPSFPLFSYSCFVPLFYREKKLICMQRGRISQQKKVNWNVILYSSAQRVVLHVCYLDSVCVWSIMPMCVTDYVWCDYVS